jgi:hypothetical protein
MIVNSTDYPTMMMMITTMMMMMMMMMMMVTAMMMMMTSTGWETEIRRNDPSICELHGHH